MSLSTSSLRILIWIGMKLVVVFYLPLFVVRIFQRSPQKCPATNDPILLETATNLVDKICKKEISCEKVIKAYIARIRDVNPLINAVVEERFGKAIEEAKAVDKMVADADASAATLRQKYPLLGVPLTVKESIAVAGLSNRAGNLGCDRLKAVEDAETVKLAREAGAIPLLVSNTPELCMNWESFNRITGRTNNPYDLSRTPGGSSGGEASLLSCAASIIGLGSDVAGSLRWPAHCCGIWGHKPTARAVSIKGHYPDCRDIENWKDVFAVGPMARYAADLPLILGVIADPGLKTALRLEEPVQLRHIKIYYSEDFGSCLTMRTSREIVEAMRSVVKHMQLSYDIKPEKVDHGLLKYATDLAYTRLLSVNGIEGWFPDHGKGFFAEAFRYITCRSKISISALTFGLLQNLIRPVPRRRIEKTRAKLEELRTALVDLLGDDGVLFCPTFPTTATKHYDVFRNAFSFGPLALFSSIGFPVTNCPIGLSPQGLPMGMQVAASPNCDRLTLAVAREIEKTFGGWVQPSPKNLPVIA